MTWSRGTKLISETSPELGVGVVLTVDGEYVDVFFPDADRHLRLSTSAAGIEPIELVEGDEVRLRDGRITTIKRITGEVAVLADGSQADVEELWPHLQTPTLVDRLASSEVDPLLDVLNRVDGQRLLNLRQRTEVADLVGARVEVEPDEVAMAIRLLDEEIVRCMLAAEPGVGRMKVSCMAAASLVRSGRAESAVVIAPHRRALRWVASLYKRFHQLFVHVDFERWRDVREEIDFDANPFEVHPLSVISSGLLASEEELLEHLLDASPDLVVVDEADQAFKYLRNRLFVPLTEAARHALTLTGPTETLDATEREQFSSALGEGHRVFDVPPDDGRRSAEALDVIPTDFEETLRRFCLDAADQVELDVESRNGEHTYYFEYGPQVKVDALPGLRAGARYLGTFDRRSALEDESLEFFACGHPLVEGLLAELRLSSRGRVGAVRLRRDDAPGFHGLYLIVVEGDEGEWAIRLVPLMDASGAPASPEDNERRARALYAALDMGIELEPERVKALMGRVANHPLLEGLDARTLSQAVLVAVMDQGA